MILIIGKYVTRNLKRLTLDLKLILVEHSGTIILKFQAKSHRTIKQTKQFSFKILNKPIFNFILINTHLKGKK